MDDKVRIGIVGAGGIANNCAKLIKTSSCLQLQGICSRRIESASDFASKYDIPIVFKHWQEMADCQDIDLVYIAIPTSLKETIAVGMAEAGKHIIVEKPFISSDSVKRIVDNCRKSNVSFMDATHFTHHPRTHFLNEHINEEIGVLQSMNVNFFIPLQDKQNIRYNEKMEPHGAIADLGWYCMRAVVEFNPQASEIKTASVCPRIDVETGSIVGASSHLVFDNNTSLTWQVGYDVGACLMDCDLYGNKGAIQLNDYVQNWTNSIEFNAVNTPTAYVKKTGLMTPNEFVFHEFESPKSQALLMFESVAKMIKENTVDLFEQHASRTLKTQSFLDVVADSLQMA